MQWSRNGNKNDVETYTRSGKLRGSLVILKDVSNRAVSSSVSDLSTPELQACLL